MSRLKYYYETYQRLLDEDVSLQIQTGSTWTDMRLKGMSAHIKPKTAYERGRTYIRYRRKYRERIVSRGKSGEQLLKEAKDMNIYPRRAR